MADAVRTASAEAICGLLDGDGQFLAPARLLSDLTEEQAMAVPPGSPYSIAQVAAHLRFWQQREIVWARGETPPKVDDLEATFTAPPAGTWHPLVQDVLACMEQLKHLAREQAAQPSVAYNNGTVGYGLATSALHNGYHLGQIVLLRRMQGFWPPAGDDNDW